MNESQARWRVQFYGKVQFVGFRYTARLLAGKLNLTGWVRNMPDGSVLLEAQGDTARLRKLLIRLKSQEHFHITKVTIRVLSMEPDERQFQVRQAGLSGTE